MGNVPVPSLPDDPGAGAGAGADTAPDRPAFVAIVPPEAAGTRLDRWLATAHGDQSRSRLKALIETGALTLDGLPTLDPSRKVRPGQRAVLIEPPPEDATPRAQAVPLSIAYEDAHVIVVDKPAGLVVHPAPGSPDRTLVNALLAHCGDSLSGIGGVRRPGIVHRLDKDTSGLMVVAKTDRAHRALAAQFADRTLHRVYQALVWGVPSPARGEIDAPIGRHPTARTRMAVVPAGAPGAKPALTRYATRRVWGMAVTLVECRLATGRTHQIRVHMAHMGHPLVGDATYGRIPRRTTLEPAVAARLTGLDRQALHAVEIGFIHPDSGDPMRLRSRIPGQVQEILDVLEAQHGGPDAAPR
ncbi:RluA family pseudouridine synthase [Roseospira visakhapatnamensis]|uniref:Pseudouridine synthase n=1 Tax=Roseospira visakhapatnamensis TaxID=390880 RepID=A0A7W6RCY3_9PROT|nr:RluA family pseudouridine synthase [Roseospira visakhapatnamensis]MBB4266276.1 23S rRNA pseudouridine1911/1915/1917 synthase [Roseospira visakhapatnamensis]